MKDVHQTAGSQNECATADRHATSRRTFVGMTQYSPGEAEQEEWKYPIEAPHRTGDHKTGDATKTG